VKFVLLLALALTAQPPREPGAQSSSPQARTSMDAFGRCVARRSPARAAETLERDFTTHTYQSALRNLSRANESCFQGRGRMRSANLLFAGAMAEGLLAADTTPLNVRLARAATQPTIASRSDSDWIAICVVRSVPDDVARLFATPVASQTEVAALEALAPAFLACNRNDQALHINAQGRRAILATAAFRTVHAAGTRAAAAN
jgi:hypothetical protein